MATTDCTPGKLEIHPIRIQVDSALRRLYSEQNRDPYAPGYGCFDRRYWAWKLVDFPEATFQRNVYPLAWRLMRSTNSGKESYGPLQKSIFAGLKFAFEIQHRDGSFDQAFPNERSYGATAFLLQPLLQAYLVVREMLNTHDQVMCESGLLNAGWFLCKHAETHGLISNHLAGAALSLFQAGSFFKENRFENCAEKILTGILQSQNEEGWFPEYGAADPGYQTLCMYYLAQIYRIQPDPSLKKALERAVKFLSWFIHPDGSFGGEYGSRRTAVYYPGGIALLVKEFPIAASMTSFMLTSMANGHTVNLQDIDMGNLAPLLQNMVLTLDAIKELPECEQDLLPCLHDHACIDLKTAGISIRGNQSYYAVVGIANGGTVKVFDKKIGRIKFDDGGYIATLKNGKYISTQMTDLGRKMDLSQDTLSFESPFFEMLRSLPNPYQLFLLRGLNLTVMHSIGLGNFVKSILVNLLMQGKKTIPLVLKRRIEFHSDFVEITDTLIRTSSIKIASLSFGIPFTSIHMASARYFQGQEYERGVDPVVVDHKDLNEVGITTKMIRI